jgi:hypothetical protein
MKQKKENWIIDLALEAETDGTRLLVLDREFYRKQVAEHIEK